METFLHHSDPVNNWPKDRQIANEVTLTLNSLKLYFTLYNTMEKELRKLNTREHQIFNVRATSQVLFL